MEYIVDESKLELNQPFKAIYKGIAIVIYKTRKGVFALEDKCSHEEYPLSESTSEDDATIECMKHGSRFDITNGKAINLPAFLPVKTFHIEIVEGKVYISD